MNIEHQQQLIDFFERIDPKRIDMNLWILDTSHCGTVGCIGGLNWNDIPQPGTNPPTPRGRQDILQPREESDVEVADDMYIDALTEDLELPREDVEELTHLQFWPVALQELYRHDRRRAIVLALRFAGRFFIPGSRPLINEDLGQAIKEATPSR